MVKIPEGLIHQPKNTMPKIEHLWAFLSVDPDDGNEGVIAANIGGIPLPLIAADEERLGIVRSIAERIAPSVKGTIKLVKFTVREDVQEVGGP